MKTKYVNVAIFLLSLFSFLATKNLPDFLFFLNFFEFSFLAKSPEEKKRKKKRKSDPFTQKP
jgi:hypothetical protein